MNAPTDYSVVISHDNEIFLYVQVNPGWIGFNLPNSNVSPTLLTAAEAYFYLGWSVIPLLGDRDPARPKVPAIPWAGFQQYPAHVNDYKQWFKEDGFAGLGIVTGRISQLAVLDFDSESVFNAFRLRYPDLIETRTVRSAGRGLPHLYFRLPTQLHLASQKGQGVDLLSDGRYVVAPPTTIDGQSYSLIRGGMPKTLTERDIRRIQSFIASYHAKPSSEPSMEPIGNSPVVDRLSQNELHSIYRYHVSKKGRNEALFITSLYARDSGWTQLRTENCLVALHSQQLAQGDHRKETATQRQHEARATIRSAFSRPARPKKPIKHRNTNQLSNSVREALLQHKLTYVIRAYEGLLLAGIRPGQVITSQDAVKRLKGLVGRDSVLNALKATHNNQALFTPVSPHYVVATVKNLKRTKKCYLLESNIQEKIKRGRPQHLFRMPSNLELCQLFGVSVSLSDPLEATDISSAPKTRTALHRELIKRRPGQYTRRWLGGRLGVNKRTLDTYNRLIPIHSRKMFIETPMHWSNIERLPFDEALKGAYLTTLQGKKYPALRAIASFLLARGEGICLNEQTANFYWYGDTEPSVVELMQINQKQAQKQEQLDAFLAARPKINPERFWKMPEPSNQHHIMETKTSPKVQNKPLPPRHFHRPLADPAQEALATRIYLALNTVTSKTKISKANARRAAFMYPPAIIEDTLNCMNSPSVTNRTYNPIGFFLTMVRCTVNGMNS